MISALRESIKSWISAKERRDTFTHNLIGTAMAEIINGDTVNDIGKMEWSGIYYNFTEDRVEVNGKSSYSASSLTLIRNAFHLRRLIASCRDLAFNYPRFLLMDNVEDKGMTLANEARIFRR